MLCTLGRVVGAVILWCETKTYYHSTSTSSPQWPSLKNEAMDVAGKKSLIITRDDNGDITIEVDLVTIKN